MLPFRDNILLARRPLVTVALVTASVAVYAALVGGGGDFRNGPSAGAAARRTLVPYELTHPRAACWLGPPRHAVATASRSGRTSAADAILCGERPVRAGAERLSRPPVLEAALASLLAYGSLLPILAGLAALAVLGPTLESTLGHGRYALLYLAGGAVALGARLAASPGSPAPVLVAPAAVAAILAGYLAAHPRARVLALVPVPVFVTIVEVPAPTLIGLWLAAQVYAQLAGLAGPAHPGSAAAFAGLAAAIACGALSIRLRARRAHPAGAPA